MPLVFLTFNVGDAQFGTPPDYSQFDADGSLIAYGEATYFRDELQSLITARIESPSSDFQLNAAEGSVTAKISARYPTDYVTMNLQLNHDWLPGTTIFPHLHWWQTTADMPHWVLAHRWQRQGAAKVTDWAPFAWSANIFTYTAGTLSQITRFPGITPAAGTFGPVSDIVQLRLYRDYLNASTLFEGNDPVNASQDIVNLDVHLEIDRQGSRQEYVR